jgi:hypothetical protein
VLATEMDFRNEPAVAEEPRENDGDVFSGDH